MISHRWAYTQSGPIALSGPLKRWIIIMTITNSGALGANSRVKPSKQDPNAGSSRLAECRSQNIPKRDFGHFWSSRQHADGCVLLARYDFLLVFQSDVRSSWNRCRVYESPNGADSIIIPRGKNNNLPWSEVSNKVLSKEATRLKNNPSC